MSSVPLAALAINQQQPSPLEEYGKVMQLRSLANQQQLQQGQQQLQQGQIQQQQYNLASQKALNDAYQGAVKIGPDGSPSIDTDVLQKGLAANNRGSLIPEVLKGVTDYQQSTAKLQQTWSDLAAARTDQLASLGATIKAANYDPGLTDSMLQSELAIPNLPQAIGQRVAQIRQQFQQHPETIQPIVDQLIAASPKQAGAQRDIAQANEANTKAALDQIKLNLAKNSKPGDFDAQIDQIAGSNPQLAMQAKALVNGNLARGDVDGARQALDQTFQRVGSEQQAGLNRQAEFLNQGLNRQAQFSNTLQKDGLDQVNKMFTDPQHGYAPFLAQANATKGAIADAKNGNELAASLAPLMTVLGVNSFAGVHRINPAEYQAAGPQLGSIYRRVNALLDKTVSGSIPADTMNEMNGLVDQLIQTKHASILGSAQMIAQGTGLDPNKLPVLDPAGKVDTLANVAKGAQQQQTQSPTGTGDSVRVQLPGHPPGTIPRSALGQFQKDNPNAQVLQ